MIESALLAVFPFGEVILLPSATSTNDVAIDRAKTGAREGTLILTEHQTSGRGRRGAEWFAEPGTALIFSLVLRPSGGAREWARLTSIAALALARAVELATGLTPGIKWPNDLYLGSRKNAGILVEATGDFAILGIGLNVNTAVGRFPESLKEVATSLRATLGDGTPIPRESLVQLFLENFSDLYPSALEFTDFMEVLAQIRLRSTLLHRKIVVVQKNSQFTGIARDFGVHGELLVEVNPGLPFAIVSTAERVRLIDP